MQNVSTPLMSRSRAAAMAHRRGKVGSSVPTPAPAPAATPEPVRRRRNTVSRDVTSRARSQRPAPSRRVARPPVAAPVAENQSRELAKQRRKMQSSGRIQASPSASLSPSAASTSTTRGVRTRSKPEAQLPTRRQGATQGSIAASVTRRPARATSSSTSRTRNDRKKGVKTTPKALTPQGRQLSKAWRRSSSMGRNAQDAYRTKSSQTGALAKMSNPRATTRDIAKKVRAERCSRGGKSCTSSSSTEAKRQRHKGRRGESQGPTAPPKVSYSSTLSGQTVSGVHVGQGKMTGAEVGSCQNVSGTEYLGSEEFTTHCNTQPTPAPAKVRQTQTLAGQSVSGNEVGRSESVTGDLAGQCQSVTGTEYLPADQSALFCQADDMPTAPSAPVERRISVMSTPSTDQAERRKAIVTGADKLHFENRSNDLNRAPVSAEAPRKVNPSRTFAGNTTTGTQVGRNLPVTGDERGYCHNVTGTGYQGVEEVEEICQTSVTPPPSIPAARFKQPVTNTLTNQTVTGERAGRISGATGSESGACQAVTGTAYTGAESFSRNCSPPQVEAIAERQVMPSQRGQHPLSGLQPGLQGLTGAQKGACSLITGTGYHGADQTAAMCQTPQSAQPGESDYPIVMGSGAAQSVSSREATTAADAADSAEEPTQPKNRVTGDGWDRGTKVTGTEGPWATERNPSKRGQSMQMRVGARYFRPKDMEEVPQSPITGSAGNTGTGAKVTLSGGARA